MKEPAWTGCENFEGTKIWRIEKFKVKIIFLQFALVLWQLASIAVSVKIS